MAGQIDLLACVLVGAMARGRGGAGLGTTMQAGRRNDGASAHVSGCYLREGLLGLFYLKRFQSAVITPSVSKLAIASRGCSNPLPDFDCAAPLGRSPASVPPLIGDAAHVLTAA